MHLTIFYITLFKLKVGRLLWAPIVIDPAGDNNDYVSLTHRIFPFPIVLLAFSEPRTN